MIPRPQRAAQYYPQIMVRFQRIVTLLSGGGQKGGGATLSAPPGPGAAFRVQNLVSDLIGTPPPRPRRRIPAPAKGKSLNASRALAGFSTRK